MEKQIRVTWTIDVYAKTPEEAVAKAILMMPVPIRDEESFATHFETIEIQNGKFVEGSAVEIDTLELEGEERNRFISVLDGEEDEEEGQDRESYTDDQDRDSYTQKG